MTRLLLALTFLFSSPFARAQVLRDQQPVVIVSRDASGTIVDLKTRTIEGDYIAQKNLDQRPDYEESSPSKEEIARGYFDLEVSEHDHKKGITRRTALVAKRSIGDARLAGYVAYSTASRTGYVKALDAFGTWSATTENGERFELAAYDVSTGPRRYEILSGPGMSRNIVRIPRGEILPGSIFDGAVCRFLFR